MVSAINVITYNYNSVHLFIIIINLLLFLSLAGVAEATGTTSTENHSSISPVPLNVTTTTCHGSSINRSSKCNNYIYCYDNIIVVSLEDIDKQSVSTCSSPDNFLKQFKGTVI